MAKYVNTSGVPMSLAVFLATDSYDHNHDPQTISATALLKPIRQSILAARLPDDVGQPDLTQMMASRMGTAIHDGIERAWKTNYQAAMQDIGIPTHVVKKVKINPEPAEVDEDTIAVYMEQRAHRRIGEYTISGKFDFVINGRVEDFKSTSVYSAISHNSDQKHAQQGSIYRWLRPDIITQDEMAIQYIFTDWAAARARTEANYPKQRFQERILPLMSIAETTQFIRQKLEQFDKFKDIPEYGLPLCTGEELWRSEPVFKYYKNPEKTARSTKNFDTRQDAVIHMATEGGGKGLILEKPGQVTACKYCSAFPICTQKDALVAQGQLIL